MPRSCHVVFLLLSSLGDGDMAVSTRDLAEMGRISPAQVWRALRRLQGARLVELVRKGKGHGKSVWRVRWSFPQVSVSSPFARAKVNPPSERNLSSPETTAPPRGVAWSNLPIRNKTKALRWTMWRLRREIRSWGLPPPRREAFLRGLGNALWRALKRGLVRTTAQLRRLLWEVLGHLRDAPAGVSASLRRACGYSGAIVLLALRSLGLVPWRPSTSERLEPDPTEALQRRLEDLRRLYLAPWLSEEERRRIAEEVRRLRGDKCPSDLCDPEVATKPFFLRERPEGILIFGPVTKGAEMDLT